MRMPLKISKLKLTELGLIFLVWLVSVAVSSQVFVFNRALNAPFEGISAHTLVSMRGFEDWGFWKLLGASVLFPISPEFIGVDLTALTKPEVYLSYPSLWLVLPYTVFKLLNLFHLNVSLSPQYLQVYSLIFNRLLCAVVIYYLYFEIIKILTQNTLTDYQKRVIALLGLIGWIFTPPVLYWTQNVYFTDEAVLLPVYTIFLISLRSRFNLNERSNLDKFLLFIASFFACGFDWYGWISIAIILFIKIFNDSLSNKTNPFFSITFLKQYLNSVKFILLGVIASGFTFLLQLIYFKDGIRQVLAIFFLRASGMSTDSGASLTLLTALHGIVMHWGSYFPRMVQPFLVRVLDSDIKNLTNLDPVVLKAINESKEIGSINAFIPLIIGFILFIFCLYYLYKKSKYKRFVAYAYTLVLLVPLIQLFILKQHSFMHYFSAFKMALPITFSILVLPVLSLSQTINNTLSSKSFSSRKNNTVLSVFVASLGIVIVISSVGGLKEFASVGGNSSTAQDIGFLLSRNVAPMELPVTNIPELVVGPYPPEPLWYGKKYVYAYDQLQELRLRAKPQQLKSMKPIFLTYKDASFTASDISVCQGKWIDLAEKVNNRKVVACKAVELGSLLAISSSPKITNSLTNVDILGVKSVKEILLNPTSGKSLNGYFDLINGSTATKVKVPKTTLITVSGWAILPKENRQADRVLITAGDKNSLVTVASVELDRQDVAASMKNSAYKNSGWSITFNSSVLPAKKVVLKAWAYNSETKEAIQLSSTHEVVLN